MPSLVFLLFCLSVTSYSCEAYKALVVYPMPSKSHGILGDGIVRQLLKDGNEVTYVTSLGYKNPPPNLRQVNVSVNIMSISRGHLSINNLLDKKFDINNHSIMKNLMITLVVDTLKTEEFKQLLGNSDEHFDVVIVEWMFSEILSGLAAVYECPLIWMCPMEVNNAILGLVDTMPNPAYSSDGLSANMPPFTFRQRLEELWTRLKVSYLNYMYFEDMEAKEYNTHIGPYILKRGRQPPPYYDVKYNASLVVGNSHVSMGEAKRLPQNYKPIGGYHINENLAALPENLQKIMDNSKHGVIYFSMGSNLQSKDWPEVIKQDLLKMFGELKQTVLWKFEEDLPNVPKNVHILKWAPQPSILSHPNCLLFISHGGLLSTTETIHYGVPIIGIPVFGDQFINVGRAVNRGFALKVDFSYDVAKELKVAIKEMLSNPTYRKKIKELTYIYHDRPVKPAQELSHWVRHVVNTRGAPHLRSVAMDVPLHERLYLDLVALLVIALIFVMRLLRLVCAMVCSKKTATSGSKKKD